MVTLNPPAADLSPELPTQSAKRRKVTRACDYCKSRKRRCTGEIPCPACRSHSIECTYLASYKRGKVVEPMSAVSIPEMQLSPSKPPEGEGLLQPSGADDSETVSRPASPEGEASFGGQYMEPASPYAFLRRAWKRFNRDKDMVSSRSTTANADQDKSIFAVGDRRVPLTEVDLANFRLPPSPTSAMLLDQYFKFAMPTYRFLHRPSIEQWLVLLEQEEERLSWSVSLLPCRQALVLIVLATSRLFNIDQAKEAMVPDDHSLQESEQIFRTSQRILEDERGRPSLESVQVRLAMCLFLLHTHRPNQAWYQFGTVVQLAMSLGLHRASASSSIQGDHVVSELRLQTFWAASTLDTYLSVMLGRPLLIHPEDVDQQHPEDIENGPSTGDSVLTASILHGKLAWIVKKAARDHITAKSGSTRERLARAAALNEQTGAWYRSLPAVLSGAIHPSSLIPVFRRQITVLRLAYAHAQMLINRPSLLMKTTASDPQTTWESITAQMSTCLQAAKLTLHAVLGADLGEQIFKAFWFTQYVAFNGVSVIYVSLIQRKRGLLPKLHGVAELEELLPLAEKVHRLLKDASHTNAPSLCYSILLDELQQEVYHKHLAAINPDVVIEASLEKSSILAADALSCEGDSVAHEIPIAQEVADDFSVDFALDPDVWLALDSLPFSDLGQFE